MKKNIWGIIVLVAAFVVAMPSQAQIKFGLKGGLNMNKVSVKGNLYETNLKNGDNAAGFFVGPTVDVTIPLAGLGVDAAILYDNKIMKVNDAKKTIQYIDIPINAKYTIGFSSLASVYVATGPQFAFNVGNRKFSHWLNVEDNKNFFKLNESEFSWNVGAGVTVLSHLRVGYNYNIALTESFEASETVISTQTIKNFKLKNNTHQISVTYLF